MAENSDAPKDKSAEMATNEGQADVWPPSPIVPIRMTEEQLGRVEAALGFSLPDFYRQTMQNLPGPLMDVFPLCDDPDYLIESNLCNREQGFFGLPWPSHYFAIGGDGAGNDYYLDLSRDDHTVYCADHEDGEFSPMEPDFVVWAREVVEEWAAYEAEQQALDQKPKPNKKWWQVQLWP